MSNRVTQAFFRASTTCALALSFPSPAVADPNVDAAILNAGSFAIVAGGGEPNILLVEGAVVVDAQDPCKNTPPCNDQNECTIDACILIGGAPTCTFTPLIPGQPCGDQDDTGCNAPDSCGVGSCTDNVDQQGTLCRESTDSCDVAEVCDGKSKVCPADDFVLPELGCLIFEDSFEVPSGELHFR